MTDDIKRRLQDTPRWSAQTAQVLDAAEAEIRRLEDALEVSKTKAQHFREESQRLAQEKQELKQEFLLMRAERNLLLDTVRDLEAQ